MLPGRFLQMLTRSSSEMFIDSCSKQRYIQYVRGPLKDISLKVKTFMGTGCLIPSELPYMNNIFVKVLPFHLLERGRALLDLPGRLGKPS